MKLTIVNVAEFIQKSLHNFKNKDRNFTYQ
jgi:hypothetical protein